MKHMWKLDENGLPDDQAWESGFHNGVYCERCGKCVCIYCDQDWEEMDDCEDDKDEPMSNADKIRAMSDEELGRFLAAVGNRRNAAGAGLFGKSAAHAIEWLKQPCTGELSDEY